MKLTMLLLALYSKRKNTSESNRAYILCCDDVSRLDDLQRRLEEEQSELQRKIRLEREQLEVFEEEVASRLANRKQQIRVSDMQPLGYVMYFRRSWLPWS